MGFSLPFDDERSLAGGRSDYLAYQRRYVDVPRASDVELIRIVSKRTARGGRVLDVGCSSGNLLRHLAVERPDLTLQGCDADREAVRDCKTAGFRESFRADVTDPRDMDGMDNIYGVVILNAVLYCLTDEQAAAALGNIHRVLKPAGALVVFDWFHPWQQRLTILEESERYGTQTLHVRPYSLLARLAREAGFKSPTFLPFKPPALEEPDDNEDLTSWTFPPKWSKGGACFRGGLAQPWCHAVLERV